ncbi:MAG: hypothetical protein GY953_49895 [bacterium]|nr:hypothetical protein [bacterium]
MDSHEREPRQWARFTSSAQFEGSPHYSPDGSRVVFSSSRSGDVEIWTCDADGSGVRQLTFLGVAGSPRWSPDGSEIAFDSVLDGNADVYVVNSSGGAPRRVTTNEAEDVVPGWSRDGEWIYFTSNRDGQTQIWKLPADGSSDDAAHAVRVTSGGGFYATEAADGKSVLYSKKRSTQTAIWRVPVNGGEETPVIENLESGWGNWCVTDGGIWFLNRKPEGDGWAVYLQATGSESPTEIAVLPNVPTRGGPGLGISPDGRWILSGQVLVESDLMRADLAR